MDKLNDIFRAQFLFERYESNLAPIFSIFEGQFDGSVYVNDCENISWAVLQTPFLQHFVAGSPTDSCADELDKILFDIILNEQDEKEVVTFVNSEKWHDILTDIYVKHRGVSDFRRIFSFSHDNYCNFRRPTIPRDVRVLVEKVWVLPNSRFDTWSAKLFLDDKIVSHCDAIIVGRELAEIDVGTEEEFRGKGYATIAATLLIDKLLGDGIEPSWSAWPFRVESVNLAQKLGFVPKPSAKAWIWMENM